MKKLNKIDINLFSDLLYYQTKFAYDKISVLNFISNNNQSYDYEKLYYEIKKCFRNLNEIAEQWTEDKYDKSDLYNLFYYYESSLYSMHNLCVKINDCNIENLYVPKILDAFLLNTNSKNLCFLTFFIEMLVSSIKSNDLWFLENFSKTYFISTLFSEETSYFGIFVFIFLFYCVNKNEFISKETKENIRKILIDDNFFINSFGMSWVKMCERFAYADFSKKIIPMIKNFLTIYDSVKNERFVIRKENQSVYSLDDSNHFSKKFLIFNCLDLMIHSINSYDYKLLKKQIDKFDEKNKIIFLNALAEYLDGYNEHSFLTFIKMEDYSLSVSENAIVNLKKILENYSLDYYDQKYKKPSKNFYESNKKKIIKSFTNESEKFIFNDSSLDNDNDVKYINLRIDNDGFDELLKFYISDFKNLFIHQLNSLFKCYSKKIQIDNYFYDSTTIDRIESFNPNIISSNNFLQASYNFLHREPAINLKNIKKVDGLDRNLFVKNGGIKTHFKIVDEETVVSPFSREEISQIIDNEFSSINGLYIYKDSNVRKTIFSLTKDELISKLEKKYTRITIAFTQNFEIDSSKILLFEKI